MVRGKVAPPSRATDLNVESLADGKPVHEFQDERAAMWHAHDMDQAKRKGLV